MSDDAERNGHPQRMSRAGSPRRVRVLTTLAKATARNRLADQREQALTVVSRTVPVALAFQQMYTWALLTPPFENLIIRILSDHPFTFINYLLGYRHIIILWPRKNSWGNNYSSIVRK